MLMRTFLVVLFAVLTATSVSCQDFPVSVACNTSSNALDQNPDVIVTESYINKTGCTTLNFDIDYLKQCPQRVGTSERRCTCTTTLGNTSAWESAVSNSSGRTCYIDLVIKLTGTAIIDNQTYPFVSTSTHRNFGFMAVGNACNDTEITGALLTPFATEGVGYLNSSLNVKSNVSGVTWTSGSVTVFACGVSSPPVTKDLIPSSNSGSSSGSNTGATTNSTTSNSGSSSNSTSSPTTVSPVTPAPTNISSSSSSTSSTGGTGTGTSTGNGNGASVRMHSATAVMVALISAATTVICAA